MLIQQTNNTNFGMLGKRGGHVAGRIGKGISLMPESRKITKLTLNYTSQIKRIYNSSIDKTYLIKELADFCTGFQDKVGRLYGSTVLKRK